MKAKRILSLLLTVAMITTCAVTAFADELVSPVSGYVLTDTTQILSGDLTLADGAAMPTLSGDGAVYVDVTVADATEDDWAVILENEGYETVDEYLGDYGYDLTVTPAYVLDVTVNNAGTLVESGGKTKRSGFGISNFFLYLDYDNADDFELGGLIASDLAAELPGCKDVGTTLTIGYSAADSNACYPVDNGTYTNATVNIAKYLVFAKPDTVLTMDSKAQLMYANYKNGGYGDANGAEWLQTVVAFWHAPSVTIGGTPGPVGPVVEKTEAIANNGITVDGVTYDNAFGVNATITPADEATEIGVLFAPALWLDGEALVYGLEGAKKVSKTGLVGGTAVTFKAAIKDIPRALTNVSFDMVTRAYAKDGEAVEYADALTTAVLFGNTK